jgi:acyl dehydratase
MRRLSDGRLVGADTLGDEGVLVAAIEAEFLAPIRAGDTVTVTEREIGRERKVTKGGLGEFVSWERDYVNGANELLVRERGSYFFFAGETENRS